MGILTDIRKSLLETWTPAAFSKQEPAFHGAYVVIEDVLTRMHNLWCPTEDGLFTTEALIDSVLRPVLQRLRSPGCVAYVVIADQQRLVPKRKHELQHERTFTAKVQPYPNEAQLCLRGITLPGAPGPQKIELSRLIHNRVLRSRLWELVTEVLDSLLMPAGTTLIFDHFWEGPRVYQGAHHATWPRHRHPFGESEIAMAYWCHQFSDLTAVVVSTDTDVLPIFTHYLHQTTRQKPVYWRYRGPKGPIHVHLQQVVSLLKQQHRLSAYHFLFYTVICGSDYFNKKTILYNVGHVHVFNVLPLVPRLARRALHDAQALVKLVTRIYTELLSYPVGTTLDDLRQAQDQGVIGKRYRIPHEADILAAHSDLRHNLGYWSVDWLLIPQHSTELTYGETAERGGAAVAAGH